MKFNDAYYDSVTDKIAGAESGTAAELVVVIHPASGSYRDIHLLCGAGCAWLALLFFLFSDFAFAPIGIPFEIVLIFALAAWTCSLTPLARLLTLRRRRIKQVRIAAAAAFTEENVSHTRARTGVLIYYSILEREAEVIADSGVLAAVPAEKWQLIVGNFQASVRAGDAAATLLAFLGGLGELLGQYLPAGEDNPDELPNRPRVS